MVSVFVLLIPVSKSILKVLSLVYTLAWLLPDVSVVKKSFTPPKLSHTSSILIVVSIGWLTYSKDLVISVSLCFVRSTVVFLLLHPNRAKKQNNSIKIVRLFIIEIQRYKA